MALLVDLMPAELAWWEALRTRLRRARLHLAPTLTQYVRVQWLSDQDALTGVGAIAAPETLAAAHD